MIHAYDERYLDDAMKNLGEAVDYGVCICGMDINDFLDLFVVSRIAEQFENGSPKYVSGLSGTELAEEILHASGYEKDLPLPRQGMSLSPEYWCGWTLALYQWYSGNTFKKILENIDGNDLLKMYPTLHEAPEEKSLEIMERMMEKRNRTSRLQKIREARGLSQSRLAEKSGVNLRTLQQYETKAKNINKAAAATLLTLSRTLGCKMIDLLEN